MGNTSTIGDLKEEMAGLLVRAADVVAQLEPRDLPTSHTPALLGQFAALERLAAAGRVLLAKKAAESELWRRQGFRSAAEWLAAQQGCSNGKARDDLATSERLAGLDDTADALREGRLSPEQAGAIADAASVNPDAEADLLDLAAQESLKNLRDEAARRKAEREDLDKKTERIRRNRNCRSWIDRDGAWNLHAKGTASDGAGFDVEHAHLLDERFAHARRSGIRETRDNYSFDALMDLARLAGSIDDSTQPAETGDTDDTDETAETAEADRPTHRRRRENLRRLSLLRVDLEALVRGALDDDETCEIAGIGPISVSAARELLGESILKLVITNGVDVANVTHLGRGANAAQQVALLWQQPLCTARGCTRHARLQNDHRHDWALDRRTNVRNLDPLCEHHHNLKTRQNWALVPGTGTRTMVPPDHPDHPANAPPGRD